MLPLGTLFGVRIGAHWTLALLVAAALYAFGLVDGAVASLGLLTSVLVHELAHAVVALRCGVRVAGIDLRALGGRIALHASPASMQHEARIAMAGPLASGALLAVAAALAWATSSFALGAIAAVNAVLFVSNALPILPLDGGRAVRAWLAQRTDRVTATRVVAVTNFAAGLACLALAAVVTVRVDAVLALPLALLGAWIGAMGVLEVRRVASEAERAEALRTLAFDPMDAPWARR